MRAEPGIEHYLFERYFNIAIDKYTIGFDIYL